MNQAKEKTEHRKIEFNNGRTEAGSIYPNNLVNTSKYTLISLLPKNLYEQFHRIANIWFLIVSIFQLLPLNLTPTSSWATIAPLSFVLAVTLAKDAYLDYKRHQSDKLINNSSAMRWDDDAGDFVTVKWMSLDVGNYIYIKQDEAVPADILILATSEVEPVCYIETALLDGETNLKIRTALSETTATLTGKEPSEAGSKAYKLEGYLKSEHPNNRLYTYEGSVKIKGNPRGIPVDNQNIILRGSTLKNTKWIIGMIIFTGIETKLVMNSKTPPHKRSNVERRVNKYLMIVFVTLFLATIVSTCISIVMTSVNEERQEFYGGEGTDTSALRFITFMILYNGLVPISLYVTMDLVRFIQSRFIQTDLRMYYAERDQPCIAKTGDLNEDLGQIEYVFSDKTGTLTENQMEFKQCSINGVIYGEQEGIAWNAQVNSHEKFHFSDEDFLIDLNSEEFQSECIKDFLYLLALWHTVIPDKQDEDLIKYQAASPDEEALVIAAHCFGWSFTNARSNSCTITVNDEQQDYSILGVNEFDSTRKRMSIVVRSLNDPAAPAILYCKGADSSMVDIMSCTDQEQETLDTHLRHFSIQGLRTLVCGKRILTPEEANQFETKWLNAKNAVADRTFRLEEVALEFERDLQLVGATAIEDKIQDGVPETIATLMKSGIKVWVLTGDKQETAINIGYSCKLLSEKMNIITVNCASKQETQDTIIGALKKYVYHTAQSDDDNVRLRIQNASNSSQTAENAMKNNDSFVNPLIGGEIFDETQPISVTEICLGLVIDGNTLQFVLTEPQIMKYFAMLSVFCNAVICCRTSPLQKSEVVKLVKNNIAFKPLCLAIGDGANDVSMIQEAHVGIGVVGKEGLQAVNSSDYAIARFRFLLPLLLLHGRWNYQRISRVILYSFYKNFLLILLQFYYSFTNLYSGSTLYDSWLIMSYNIAFTALPVIILGVMDKDLDGDIVLTQPKLYEDGIFSRLFNAKIFIKWTFLAVVQSLLLFITIYQGFELSTCSDGTTESYYVVGTIAYFCVVQISTYVIFLLMKDWTVLFVVVSILSCLSFLPFIVFYDYVGAPTQVMGGVAKYMFESPALFIMILCPLVCVFILIVERYIKAIFYPDEADKLKAKEHLQEVSPAEKYAIVDDKDQCLMPWRAIQYSKNLGKIFILAKNTEDPFNQSAIEDFKMSEYTLQFLNKHTEKSFQRYQVNRHIKFIKKMFKVLLLLMIIWTVADLTATQQETSYIIIRIVVFVLFFAVALFAHTAYFKNHYEPIILIIIICGMMAKFLNEVFFAIDGSMSSALIPIVTFIGFNISSYKLLICNVFFLVLYLIRVSVHYFLNIGGNEAAVIMVNYMALLFGILLVSAFVGFSLEKSKRKEYKLGKTLEDQVQKGQDILGNLLPKFVRDRVKQGVRYIADDIGEITILFCYIVNFDKICETHTPKELTSLLNGLFSVLDNLCEIHSVTKIETVNKTYMVAGGLKDAEQNMDSILLKKNPAERCVAMGLDIIKRLENVYLKTGEKLQVKIGINTGPVIAGVVGDHKPQFSLVGDTVNTASRMGTTLKAADAIQISQSCFEKCCHMDIDFTPSTVIPKGKGLLKTQLVRDKNTIIRQARRKTTIQDVVESTPKHFSDPATFNQQQPELAESALPLIEKKDTSKHSLDDMGINLDELISKENTDELDLAGTVQWLTCSFKETYQQRNYRLDSLERDFHSIRRGLTMTICIYFILVIIYIVDLTVQGATLGNLASTVLRAVCLSLMVAVLTTMQQTYKHFIYPWAIMTLYIIASLVEMLNVTDINPNYIYIPVLGIMYINVVINHINGLPFGYILIGSLFIMVPWIMLVLGSSTSTSAFETSFFVLVFMLINGAASWTRESYDRRAYNLNKLAEREINNTDKLLKQMMPTHVVNHLKQDTTNTDRYKDVTILFSDIVGFTQWSSERTPIEVVGMLSKLFTLFDHCCVTHDVYKVHTIGDAYVILGFSGADLAERDPKKEAQNMVNMSFEMLQTIKKVNKKKGMELNMRIGIHTGEVIAGITGTNIVRYDIYGSDVSIAEKMESNGFEGRINVSEDARKLIEEHAPDKYCFEYNQVVKYEAAGVEKDSWFISPNSN